MKITEDNFIQQIKKRDQDALEFAVKKYGGLIKKITDQILYDYPEDAEECIYESILKIWDHIGDFVGTVDTFAGWVGKIARFTALDRLRKIKKLQPTTDIDEQSIADRTITGDELFDEFFLELISCLNDYDKDIFIQIFWKGESVEKISSLLGKTKGFLYNRISRGKKKIIHNNPQYFRKEN
ncbi:MAG: sigma-70 family RNA polymerase sigma factor [Huintestinicola sp.]